MRDEDLLPLASESGINLTSLLGDDLKPLTSRISVKRIQGELKKLESISSCSRGFHVSPLGESGQVWRCDFFNFGSELAADLESKNLKLLSTAIVFEGAYPMEAPLIRVLTPRLKHGQSEGVSAGGLIALNEWKGQPMVEVLEWVRSVLCKCRLDLGATQPCYTHEEASASRFRSLLQSGHHASTSRRLSRELILESSEATGFGHREGNKVCLPVSILRDLSRDGEDGLPNPLVFEIKTSKGLRTHVGVWEFSAEEGHMIAPKWVLDNLELEEGSKVRIRMVELPRGTFLRLQPFTKRFLQVNQNDRTKVIATLEFMMPKFAAFTVGDVIETMHDGEAFRFFVLDAKPDRCINCIAEPYLDMEIDFVTALDWTQSMEGGASEEVAAPEDSGTRLGGDVDKSKVGGLNEKLCPTCRKMISEAAFDLHTAACQRRNMICESCGEVVARNSLTEHMNDQHAKIPCPQCQQVLEKYQLAKHTTASCPERRICCQYGCNFYASAKNMPSHEEMCGAKSMRCSTCARLLRKKDFESHVCETLGNVVYCPLCVGDDQGPLDGEDAFVAHMEKKHMQSQKKASIECPICIAEGSLKLGEPVVLEAHMELHKYRQKMRAHRTNNWK